MGAASIWGLTGAAFACIVGFVVGKWVHSELQRRKAATSALAQSRHDRMQLRLASGCTPLRPLARHVMKIPPIFKVCQGTVNLLEERDLKTSGEALLSLAIASAGAMGVVAGTISRSLIAGIAVAALAFVAAYLYIHNRLDKRSVAMREQIPEAMRSMSTCFRSGLSLVQTMKHASRECGGTLGRLFDVAERRLEMGTPTAEALSVLRGNEQVPELSFVVIALDVQHQSGGSIAPVLESARDSVMGELDLMRSLRVQTAQAKLSAAIVTAMPFLLVALFSVVSPDFMSPFFESLPGMGLLALALIMQTTGVMIVRRMLKIDAG